MAQDEDTHLKVGESSDHAAGVEAVAIAMRHALTWPEFNTTIYGLDDRCRGVRKGRRVVFVNPRDLPELGLEPGDRVDLFSSWNVGVERVARDFRVVAYDTPRTTAAAYYPETNPLVPLASVGIGSGTPTSKSVLVTLRPA